MSKKQVEPLADKITRLVREEPESLLAHPMNPKIHPKAQQDALLGAISDLGWLAPVIVNERTQHVLDGHARINLAISRGEKSIPVAYVDLDEALEAEALLTFDPIGGLAVQLKEQTDILLREIRTDQPDVHAFLSKLAEENGLYFGEQKPAVEDVEPQIDRAEELRELWQTESGQLWIIPSKSVPGKAHRLLCGDSTRKEAVARLMDGEKAEMVWTDPPYGVEYVGKTKAAMTIQNDGASGLFDLLVATFRNATAVCEENAPWYIAHPPGALCLTFGDAIREVGWKFHQTLIWVKDSMVLGHSDYHFRHEPIYYGYMPGSGRAGRGNHEGSHWHGDHSQTSIFEIPRPKRSEEHPTMKPPELIAQCIENSSQRGGIVLDGFAGSGSTIVAAEQTRRIGYGCEIDACFTAVILQRLSDLGLTPQLSENLTHEQQTFAHP